MTSPHNIIFAHSLWGLPSGRLLENCQQLADAGYEAVEAACFLSEAEQFTVLAEALEKTGLQLVAQIHTKRDPATSSDQAVQLINELWLQLQNYLPEPVMVNVHSGSDAASDAWNDALITCLQDLSREAGIRLSHEIHRGRATWNARACRALLERHSDIRLCTDFSHWCCVHESLLDLFSDEVALAIQHAGMIHARVGFAEGPQVSHWRAPEHNAALQAHLQWWDEIVASYNYTEGPLVITTEFGPRDYLPTLPFTRQPVADMWEINSSFRAFLSERYR